MKTSRLYVWIKNCAGIIVSRQRIFRGKKEVCRSGFNPVLKHLVFRVGSMAGKASPCRMRQPNYNEEQAGQFPTASVYQLSSVGSMAVRSLPLRDASTEMGNHIPLDGDSQGIILDYPYGVGSTAVQSLPLRDASTKIVSSHNPKISTPCTIDHKLIK